ncbi:hypothetical protein EWM64_g8536 [Hericium alpestre]|uniref:Uncharacterized protein n=1 Tax=Hericium alpestre TaxID=135208 RepID=A0A4Y9ZLI0_9AGAM|nr:hypothetical protein EWM64_g8536 [Hericium alpestre]
MDKASRDMLRRIYARKPQAPAPDPEQLYAAETLVRFKRPGFSLKHAMPNSRPAHWEPFSSRRAAPASSVPSSTRSYFPSSRKRILSSKQHRARVLATNLLGEVAAAVARPLVSMPCHGIWPKCT